LCPELFLHGIEGENKSGLKSGRNCFWIIIVVSGKKLILDFSGFRDNGLPWPGFQSGITPDY
jgi:hypothetical protein